MMRHDRVTLHHGDCLDVLRTLPDASVDSVVTDPPYGISFMGKEWDRPGVATRATTTAGDKAENPYGRSRAEIGAYGKDAAVASRAFQQWCEEWVRECLRVLKPGGHLLAFGGTRTWHRLACAVEDAGFEVRDSIAWLYGSGFPKSLDVSKAIDKAAGAEREVTGTATYGEGHVQRSAESIGYGGSDPLADVRSITAPATPDAERWQGWGTAMKPAWEGVVCATKPVAPLARIGSRLDELEQSCKPPASGAGSSSAPTHPDSHAAKTATAHASAATPPVVEPARLTPTGAAGDSSAATATSASASMGATFSSTVTSWRACWVELCEATSTSTTETTSSTTTALETLWFCLSQITPESITTDPTSPDGLSSLVEVVDAMFGAAVLTSRATRTLTAIGSAISETPPTSLDAEGSLLEPVVVARKPLVGTVSQNVLAHGTGALNIDACRIEGPPRTTHADGHRSTGSGDGWGMGAYEATVPAGRWPANVVLDESQAAALDQQSGTSQSRIGKPRGAANGEGWGMTATGAEYDDSGGASRFFYVAKAPKRERPRTDDGTSHPTVKPLALMRWLVRLVTPPGGVVLEPFAGSGTTVEACILEGFQCVAIEREADYLPLIEARIARQLDAQEQAEPDLFDLLGEATA